MAVKHRSLPDPGTYRGSVKITGIVRPLNLIVKFLLASVVFAHQVLLSPGVMKATFGSMSVSLCHTD
jgi:hypothetical protein